MDKKDPGVYAAVHATSEDGQKHLVGIKDLSVVISVHEGLWFAQGMEIDYAAQGETIEGVKKAFETGLYATVQEHLRIFGKLDKFMKPAPEDAWQEFYQSQGCHGYSQIALHETPFEFKINYLKAA